MKSIAEFSNNPQNRFINYSVILALGVLQVISATLSSNWIPLVVGLIFGVAHLPVVITRAISLSSDYDFNFDSSTGANGLREIGSFLSGLLVATGVALPLLMYHSVNFSGMNTHMTLIGGSMIYGSIFAFSRYFIDIDEEESPDLGGGVI